MMVCDMNQILESALKMGFSLEELNSVLLQKMKIEDLRDVIIRNTRNHTAWQNEEKKKHFRAASLWKCSLWRWCGIRKLLFLFLV